MSTLKLRILVVVCLTVAAGSSLVEFASRKERLLRREENVPIPIEEIHEQLAQRVLNKRASGTPTYSTSSLQDTNNYGLVHYSGGDSDTIIVMTYRVSTVGQVTTWNLYLSNDYGNTFIKINSRIGTGILLANRIFVSPEDPTKIYFADATQPKIYLSTDEGQTFSARTFSPSTISAVSLLVHPKFDDWVLARGSDNSLYVSRDLGTNPFTKIADNVFFASDYQWGVKDYDNDDSLVYYNTDSQSQQTTEVDLYTQTHPYTDDTRKEFDPSLGPHDDFLMLGRYIFVQKTINSKITLWVSVDRKPFKQAKIPTPYNHQQYIVGNINSLQALVIIRHNSSYYNLYMSEEQGELYYLALSDLKVDVINNRYRIDLEAIESMNYTTYIANQNVRTSSLDTSPSVRTLISHDVGANWEVLRPPTNADSECILPTCSLHLHMDSSEYWRTGVYSQESAPGIIIAHGVTGSALTDDNVDLYISRDGGSTWSMTLDSTWGVSVLDHGGLIIAARDYHNTADQSRTLKYTCDEGLNWSDLTFSTQNVYVYGVISEPGETSTVVSLYGVKSSSGWVVVTVDFKPVFSSTCASSDYYNWIPFDDITDTGCLLGMSVTIERRYPSHCCLNGRNYTRVVNHSSCACSSEDFECDYGYKHANGISGACVRDQDIALPETCTNGDVSFTRSQGYHKIGGDVCMGGVENSYLSYEAPCCGNSSVNGTTKYITKPPVTSTITSTSVTTSYTTVSSVSTVYTTVTSLTTSYSTVTSTSVSTSYSTLTSTSVSTSYSNIPGSTVYGLITSVLTSLSTITLTKTKTFCSVTPVTPSNAAAVNNGGANGGGSGSTMSIILGSILAISLLVIGIFVVVGVIIYLKKRKVSRGGYSRVNIAYHSSNMNSTLDGDAKLNYVTMNEIDEDDDEDDDEKPLPL